jgi:flavin-dependent dehydrogenase
MKSYQVVIIGGGPAGSACATKLISAGVDTVVLDKEAFPRHKTCAGWLRPEVFTLLGITPDEYPHPLTSFPRLRININQVPIRRNGVQYAIRRMEFDHWLLKRSRVQVIQHQVKHIKEIEGGYQIDDQFQAEHVIGAGGTNCPVYHQFFKADYPRSGSKLVALEAEFRTNWEDPLCRLWFFHNRLPGYSWYVPKVEGYLNIGIGGNADILKQRNITIREQWNMFVKFLDREGLVREIKSEPLGYTYYMWEGGNRYRINNLLLTGDSAGLATLDMGEGIGPAIASGQLAADAILNNQPYDLSKVERFSLLPKSMRWLLRR